MMTPPECAAARAGASGAELPSNHTPPIPAWRPFPLHALPRVLRDFASEEAENKGCDPVLVVLPALAALASAVGCAVRVVVRRGWIEPCALFVGVVALPSNMKTPAQRAALAPVWAAQRANDQSHAAAMSEYMRRLSEWKGTEKAERGEEPRKPSRVQCVAQNTTVEALAQVLAVNQRGVLVAHDELGGLFGGFGRYAKNSGGAECGAAFYRSAFNGETYIENRKGDGGTYLRIDCPLLSVCGGIQPGALARVLGNQRIEDGTASRFLWSAPPDNPGGWVDEREADPGISERYTAVFARLLRIPLNLTDDGAPDPAYVGLSRDAQDVARAWVNALRDRTRDESDPALRAALGKLKGIAFRLASLFHLIGWADRGGCGGFGAIGPRTMRDAVAAADWFAREAERVYGAFSESEPEKTRRELIDLIARRGGTVTLRDLTRGPREFRRDPGLAQRALDALERDGFGVWESIAPGPAGGAPTRRFRLVDQTGDSGDGDETPRHDPASRGSVTVASVAVSESVADDDLGAYCSDPSEPSESATDADGDGDGWGEL